MKLIGGLFILTLILTPIIHFIYYANFAEKSEAICFLYFELIATSLLYFFPQILLFCISTRIIRNRVVNIISLVVISIGICVVSVGTIGGIANAPNTLATVFHVGIGLSILIILVIQLIISIRLLKALYSYEIVTDVKIVNETEGDIKMNIVQQQVEQSNLEGNAELDVPKFNEDDEDEILL